LQLEEIEYKYQQKLNLRQVKELTRLMRKLEKRLAKIQNKW